MTTGEKENFLAEEREYLEAPMQDMGEVIKVMKIITGPLHNAVLKRLDSTILSEGEVFTTALMAAAGKYADLTSFEQLIAALNRLVADVESGRDPLAIDDYLEVYRKLQSGRGHNSVNHMRSVHGVFPG